MPVPRSPTIQSLAFPRLESQQCGHKSLVLRPLQSPGQVRPQVIFQSCDKCNSAQTLCWIKTRPSGILRLRISSQNNRRQLRQVQPHQPVHDDSRDPFGGGGESGASTSRPRSARRGPRHRPKHGESSPLSPSCDAHARANPRYGSGNCAGRSQRKLAEVGERRMEMPHQMHQVGIVLDEHVTRQNARRGRAGWGRLLPIVRAQARECKMRQFAAPQIPMLQKCQRTDSISCPFFGYSIKHPSSTVSIKYRSSRRNSGGLIASATACAARRPSWTS